MSEATIRTRVRAAGLGVALMTFAATSAFADDQPAASGTSQDGKVRVDVLSIKRTEGETVTLRFSLVNNSGSDFSIVLSNMHLVDLVNRRSYSPGLMSSLCSTAPGKQAECWAIFAAPPETVKKISVQFYERFDLISGVPITG
jgi:hypothetical protein